ncbi:hypothetical protein [Streptomyces sp. CFMR 7]|uniref:hypothetical protein n=1 Tax=Streptomyces sp. CFMR 7 TaxID=1649184 RepID=UPI0011A6B58C|nr:hypothetical protein [Streptomyces sp. CFMR 7]
MTIAEAAKFNPSTITDEGVLATLKAVAGERPNYVYEAPEYQKDEETQCFYVHTDETGEPVSAGCLVGAVLHRMGVPLSMLALHETKHASAVTRSLGIGLNRNTEIALNGVQDDQDSGATWGEALIRATGETI